MSDSHSGWCPPPGFLDAIDQLVIGAGGFASELLRHHSGSEKKPADGQRVTAADLAVDGLLRRELIALAPTSSGFSEEGGSFGSTSSVGTGVRLFWVIDPVDGTRPALLGGPFAVSVALIVSNDAKPLAWIGWTYVPAMARLYRGHLSGENREASLNGRPLMAGSWSDLHGRYLAIHSRGAGPFTQHRTLKLWNPGSTAVQVVLLTETAADAAGALLTRCRVYDIAGALPVALAAGLTCYEVRGQDVFEPIPLRELMLLVRDHPGAPIPEMLVTSPRSREAWERSSANAGGVAGDH